MRTSKFITNRLLARKQFHLTVLHPTRPNVSRTELGEKLAALYKTDKERVVVFGLKTKFGGGSSSGFGLVYDDEESQKKFEPRYRLVRVSVDLVLSSRRMRWDMLRTGLTCQSGLAPKVEKASRKLRKERKNRSKKVRGKAKSKAGEAAKKK